MGSGFINVFSWVCFKRENAERMALVPMLEEVPSMIVDGLFKNFGGEYTVKALQNEILKKYTLSMHLRAKGLPPPMRSAIEVWRDHARITLKAHPLLIQVIDMLSDSFLEDYIPRGIWIYRDDRNPLNLARCAYAAGEEDTYVQQNMVHWAQAGREDTLLQVLHIQAVDIGRKLVMQ